MRFNSYKEEEDLGRTLIGEVLNKSSWKVQFTKVYVNQFDPKTGQLIGQDSAYAGDDKHFIAPGASASFKIYSVEPNSRIEVFARGRYSND